MAPVVTSLRFLAVVDPSGTFVDVLTVAAVDVQLGAKNNGFSVRSSHPDYFLVTLTESVTIESQQLYLSQAKA